MVSHQQSPTRLNNTLLIPLYLCFWKKKNHDYSLRLYTLLGFLTRQRSSVQIHHSIVYFRPATSLTPHRIVRNQTLMTFSSHIALTCVDWLILNTSIDYQNGSGSIWKRRQALMGVGTLVATAIPATLLLAEGNLQKWLIFFVSLLHSSGTKNIKCWLIYNVLQRYQKVTQLLWIEKTGILIITHQTGGWVSFGFVSFVIARMKLKWINFEMMLIRTNYIGIWLQGTWFSLQR